MADSTESRLCLTLASTLETIHRAEDEAKHFAERAGFSEDDRGHIAMAVRECTANAVIHGNHYSHDKKVHLCLETVTEHLKIKVSDEGLGFDPEILPDPLSVENILRGSGRGVFLMKTFMDEVHFRNLNPGIEITLCKRMPGR